MKDSPAARLHAHALDEYAIGYDATGRGSAGRGGVKGAFDPSPPEHILTSFHAIFMVKFGGYLPNLPSF